jgi:hypothetical protein
MIADNSTRWDLAQNVASDPSYLGDTLVMRRPLVSDEDLGAEAPTALRGTLLKSAEEYR